MKNIIKKVILIWTLILVFDVLLSCFDIYSKYLIIDNILKLLRILYVLICPITILLLIPRLKAIRIPLIVVWSTVLILMFFPISLIMIFSVSDLRNNNGYRPVFEKHIIDGKYFTIYRSPDMGAFGGDNIVYAIDRKLPFGFVKRHLLSSDEYKSEIIRNVQHIYIGEDTIILDNLQD